MYLTFNLLEEIHFICWLTTNDHGGGFDISETKGVVLATSEQGFNLSRLSSTV
jgi:hypothetical protein